MVQHQGVTRTHQTICLTCAKSEPENGNAWMTSFGDGSYEWQCRKNSSHRGTGVWPKGTPAYERAVDPSRRW